MRSSVPSQRATNWLILSNIILKARFNQYIQPTFSDPTHSKKSEGSENNGTEEDEDEKFIQKAVQTTAGASVGSDNKDYRQRAIESLQESIGYSPHSPDSPDSPDNFYNLWLIHFGYDHCYDDFFDNPCQ